MRVRCGEVGESVQERFTVFMLVLVRMIIVVRVAVGPVIVIMRVSHVAYLRASPNPLSYLGPSRIVTLMTEHARGRQQDDRIKSG